MKHLIVIPVHNEARYLADVIAEIKKYLCEGADILAIDDGSTDETPAVLAATDDIEVLTHPTNLGYGRTLIDGFNCAIDRGYDHVMTEEFCKTLDKADVVSGSRYLLPSNEEPPADRREINERVTAMINEITGYGITDAFCGFKAYLVDAVKRLELTEPGYGMPMQFWIQAWLKGLTVTELPVGLVYFDRSRTFPGPIEDAEKRTRYYVELIERELKHGQCDVPNRDTPRHGQRTTGR